MPLAKSDATFVLHAPVPEFVNICLLLMRTRTEELDVTRFVVLSCRCQSTSRDLLNFIRVTCISAIQLFFQCFFHQVTPHVPTYTYLFIRRSMWQCVYLKAAVIESLCKRRTCENDSCSCLLLQKLLPDCINRQAFTKSRPFAGKVCELCQILDTFV
jgi:hypothetical protein